MASSLQNYNISVKIILRPSAVMHDGLVVVARPECDRVYRRHFVEVSLGVALDVVPHDLDVVIPVVAGLLVEETQTVKDLVDGHHRIL